MSEYKLLIGGEMVDGRNSIDVINPATEQVIATCPTINLEQLDKTVEAAASAFENWRQTGLEERKARLLQMADVIKDHAEELAELLTREQGKPLSQARDEVFFSQVFCRYFAEQQLPMEVLCETDEQRIEIHRKPLGVVVGICPWNFPLLIAVYKIAPALIAGNTIIIKPAATTPLTALRLGELIRSLFPSGVVNIIADNNDMGPAITGHPGIAKISFTGSTPTGKKIMASAADTLKRLTLELGGNDAAIVLDDVDPKSAAQGIFGAAFLNSGQVCIALKRLYVHERIYDQLCEEIAALAQAAVVGNGLEEGTQFGPVQNKMQYQKVWRYIENARQHGKIIAGGELPQGPGYFIPLTVVRDIEDGTAVVDEEPFGPILPIIQYSDLDDVIKRANHSLYGLGGSVWSSNIERAQEVAKRIDSGTVWINQHCAFGPNIPFPPAKESGLGVEWGKEGLQEFTAMQVININKAYSTPVH